MKARIAFSLLASGLFCTVILWRSDHVQLLKQIDTDKTQFSELKDRESIETTQLDKVDGEKNTYQNEYSASMDETNKALDQRNKLADEVDDLKQQNAVLAGQLLAAQVDVKSLKSELADETKLYQDANGLYQDVSRLERQRAQDFNNLLAAYKEVCAQLNQLAPVATSDPRSIQYSQFTGEAAKDFPDPSLPPPPQAHVYTFTPNGAGGGTISGK